MVFSFCLGGVVEEETRGKNRALSITQHLCPLLEACASAPGTVFLIFFFRHCLFIFYFFFQALFF